MLGLVIVSPLLVGRQVTYRRQERLSGLICYRKIENKDAKQKLSFATCV